MSIASLIGVGIEAPAPPTSPLSRLRWALADGLVMVKRNLSHIRRVPEKILNFVITPIIFVLLFAYVFGSAIDLPDGGNYREFLMPGIFVQSMIFTISTTAVGVADDMSKGIIDRFRSLPMARSAALVGRTGADLVQSLLGIAVMCACGLAVGWRPHDGLWSTLGGFGILLVLGYAMSWLGAFLGLVIRAPEAAQVAVTSLLFPLTFAANTFVPTDGMPNWLQHVADWNPISAAVAACRDLFGSPGGTAGGDAPLPLEHPVAATLIWSAVILLVFLPLAVRQYRTATSK
ncbi:ABC transporter permease [Streptomyces sp. NPDC102405]|uniref:ABC transporter permease n=1 Tax=Streptomyces sp. NPDC102405 TaxID=3366170 RepID=UPI0038122C55